MVFPLVAPALFAAGSSGAFAGLGAGAAGGGFLSGIFGSQLGKGALGGLLGGGLGGIFGGSGGGGFNRSLSRSLRARTASLKSGVENFEEFGGRFLDQFRAVSPGFAALEERTLSDFNDTARTARLEAAFQSRLGQQQAGRGLFRSPSAALQSSFAGLQFQEQLRQQSFGNLLGFQTQLAQPLTTGFFEAGLPNIQADLGFQQLAFDTGAQQARNQSIAGGISEGFNAGIGFGSQGNVSQSAIQQAISNVFSSGG